MLDLYSPSTEQFIADFYTRTDRLESRRRTLFKSLLGVIVILPLAFILLQLLPRSATAPLSHLRPYRYFETRLRAPFSFHGWHSFGYTSPLAEVVPEKPVDSGVSIAPEEAVRRFPGDPNPLVTGKAYWGAAIAGNGDPSRHEAPTDTSLSIRRTFWQWSDATNKDSKMYKTIEADLAANRLPFVSVKTPGWNNVANGSYDNELDAILTRLEAYGKPVWFAVHHEPEGGGGRNAPDDPGGAAAWRAMQTHVRERMNALRTQHIAFVPILMSYTWNPSSGRNPEEWWVPGIWDAYFVDLYHDNEKGDMLMSEWSSFVSWIEAKGLPFGTAEWGNRGEAKDAATEMRAFWDWSFENKKDVIAYTYFDSSLNSPSGSWELKGQALTTFQDILANDPKVQRLNDL